MKIISNLSKLALIASFLLCLGSCDDDDNNNVIIPPTETIAEFVTNNTDYSSLKAALDLTDLTTVLSGTDEFTVFAPNNTAFESFLTAAGFADLTEVDTPEEIALVKSILLNHVINGTNRSSSLTTGYVNNLSLYGDSTDQFLSMYLDVDNNTVTVNGGSGGTNTGAIVSEADIAVTNGVIHAVDAVIQLPTVVTFATVDPNFSRLVEGLTAYSFDYATTLQGVGPFTVFAPDNTAFDNLLATDDTWNSTADIPEATLEAVLNLHVVSGTNIRAADLTDGELTTLGGALTVEATAGTLTDGSDPAIVSTITTNNVQAANGVIHVINEVLLASIPQ